MIPLLEEPMGATYKQLISLAFDLCDEFILVKRDQMKTDANAEALLLELQPHLREMRKQESWPGTELMGHDAEVYYFDCNEETKALILGKAERLYEWTQPERLEDLCFFRNQEPWLVTIAHERQGFIKATEDYDMKRIEAIEGIVIGK